MLIKRLYLRNFRVYEDELDLELPPGLVGIYGPNGAGKSTLLEAILWTLWGKARTGKELIRSSGAGRDCVTEVEFEHEGHLYLVRRSLKGINSTVGVEAHADGVLMSTGVREAERYIESILGLDDGAFRASVFTEQKQLAAFSDQSPADRRRLVLQLLGVTPLDTARDAARKDARQLAESHDRLRNMLDDLAELETAVHDGIAKAEAAEKIAAEEAGAAEAASKRVEDAALDFHRQDERRQEHDALVAEGRSVRLTLDRALESVAERTAEMDDLRRLSEILPGTEEQAAGRGDDEQKLELVLAAASAAASVERISVPDRPPDFDVGDLEITRTEAANLRESLAATSALLAAASADVSRAKEAADRSACLTGEGDCPTCGQPLGSAFETVQAHRAAELDRATNHHQELVAAEAILVQEAADAEKRLSALTTASEQHRTAITAWEQASCRLRDAVVSARAAWADSGGEGDPPGAAELAAAIDGLRIDVERKRAAEKEALSLRVRLEAKPRVEEALARGKEEVALASASVEALREKVRALGFRPEELQRAAEQREATVTAARAAAANAQAAAVGAAEERERARAAVQRLEDARSKHAKLAELESDSLHTGRVADLLSEFRNTVVASVGPRLAVHAADLFAELTDREYDGFEVDPETFKIQISDGGHLYGLERFSGSEVDLANLALRVAISEHIHFQSGGSVGLLVLDEVFGPLDEDRKARMLLALERLRGRFRQVLVVTHDAEIKEQLPAAIEVVKRPGRRATAQILD